MSQPNVDENRRSSCHDMPLLMGHCVLCKQPVDGPTNQDLVSAGQDPATVPTESEIIPELGAAPSFTPGPWVVERSVDKRTGLTVRAPQAARAGAPNPAVCRVYDVLKERAGNARLIAAAPEMYAVLWDINEADDHDLLCASCYPERHSPCNCYLARVRAALAAVAHNEEK